jgi:hypothetical protein
MNDDSWIDQALMDNYEERCNGFVDDCPEYDDFLNDDMEDSEGGEE